MISHAWPIHAGRRSALIGYNETERMPVNRA